MSEPRVAKTRRADGLRLAVADNALRHSI